MLLRRYHEREVKKEVEKENVKSKKPRVNKTSKKSKKVED